MSREMPTVKQRSSLDGLPKQFVSSLRVLFDILDDGKTGFVKLSEIESRWDGDGVKGLPPGVVTALQKVTPANGLLSFERFVAGLKIALLRNKSDSQRTSKEKENEAPSVKQTRQNFSSKISQNFHSQPGGGLANERPSFPSNRPAQLARSTTTTTATVRPSNYGTLSQRANSVPHLAGDEGGALTSNNETESSSNRQRLVSEGAPHHKSGIANVLKSWQQGRMMNNAQQKPNQTQSNDPAQIQTVKSSTGIVTQGAEKSDAAVYRRTEPRRREPRRHTLGSGIDHNMIRQVKQLEQERDVLHQGLEFIEKAREWYHKQIADIQDKQKFLSKSGQMEPISLERNQERINFHAVRINNINQQLKALLDSSEKGFPNHMNLAIAHRQQPMRTSTSESDASQGSSHMTTMLKAQNRMLTKEVTQKSERISQLEREKVTLVRQLFEARSSKDAKKNYGDDTTFM